MVKINDKNVIIDFGQSFNEQLRENRIRQIDYAFLTHAHDDHSAEFSLFSTAKNCTLAAPADVWKELGQSRLDWLARKNKNILVKDFEPMTIDGVQVDTIKLLHQKNYKRQGDPDPCYGYLFKDKNFSFAYCSDYNEILEPNKMEGLDLIISDGNGWENDGKGHLGISGSIEVFNQFKPKKMILTHIPCRGETETPIEHSKLVKFLKPYGHIMPAYDGMEVDC